jgi:hypothetical protein
VAGESSAKIAKEEKVLEWLFEGSVRTGHEFFRQKQVVGTGKWFLDTAEFQNWTNGTAPTLLFCPGEGKRYQTHFEMF